MADENFKLKNKINYEDVVKYISKTDDKDNSTTYIKFTNLSKDINLKLTLGDPILLAQFLTLIKGKEIHPENISYCNIEYFTYGKKELRVDLLIILKEDNQGKKKLINLEMQNQFTSTLDDRMLNYMSSILSYNTKKGDDSIDFIYEAYWIMPQEAAINYKVGDTFIYSYGVLQHDPKHKRLQHEVNVINLQEMSSCGILELEDIARLFLAKNKDDISKIKTKIGKEWCDKLMILNEDFVKYYSDFLTREDERQYKTILLDKFNLGKAEGITEGETRKAINIARNMLNKGYDVNMIKDCTGLSIKEIERILSDNIN